MCPVPNVSSAEKGTHSDKYWKVNKVKQYRLSKLYT